MWFSNRSIKVGIFSHPSTGQIHRQITPEEGVWGGLGRIKQSITSRAAKVTLPNSGEFIVDSILSPKRGGSVKNLLARLFLSSSCFRSLSDHKFTMWETLVSELIHLKRASQLNQTTLLTTRYLLSRTHPKTVREVHTLIDDKNRCSSSFKTNTQNWAIESSG